MGVKVLIQIVANELNYMKFIDRYTRNRVDPISAESHLNIKQIISDCDYTDVLLFSEKDSDQVDSMFIRHKNIIHMYTAIHGENYELGYIPNNNILVSDVMCYNNEVKPVPTGLFLKQEINEITGYSQPVFKLNEDLYNLHNNIPFMCYKE